MRPELRLFGDDHGIYVLDGKLFIREQLFGVLQKEEAVRAFPLRVGVGKMRADVAEPCRTQQRIAKRVSEHVTVGMTHRALIKRQLDSADDELSPFGQAVQIVPDAATSAHALC